MKQTHTKSKTGKMNTFVLLSTTFKALSRTLWVQDDAWTVVTAFFNAKGLVRQQLDSFNEFINSNMQEIVDEHGTLVIKPESQHNPGHLITSTY
jgi:DNA-directed RNA polymerase beta subunit